MTELGLTKRGCKFIPVPGGIRIDTEGGIRKEAIFAEIYRRGDILRPQLAGDSMESRAVINGGSNARWGRCQRCGDRFEAHRGGDCYLCICAIRWARKTTAR